MAPVMKHPVQIEIDGKVIFRFQPETATLADFLVVGGHFFMQVAVVA